MAKKNKQKGKLHMDLVIGTLWLHKQYSALVEDAILLVDKSTRMSETNSRAFAPRIVGVG